MAETTVLRSSSINRTPNAGAKPQATLSGALPVVQVNMNSGGPQISGGQGTARQGVTLLPPKGAKRDFTTGGLPNQPAKQSVTVFPPKGQLGASAPSSPLTADQLLLCRHLADKYLAELRAAAGETPAEETPDNIKLAEAAIVAIDATMAAMTTAAAMAAATAAAANAAPTAPAPRTVSTGVRSPQNMTSTTPRRVSRPAPPPVAVKMDDTGTPVIVSMDADPLSQGSVQPNQANPIEIESGAQG